jgi:serine/threonine protein kinase
MTPEKWRRLNRLFEEALELAAEDRAAFVERVRGEDEYLGSELASLLRGHEQQTWSLDQPLMARAIFEESSVFAPGRTILARFQITRLLGRGGMGEVYQAMDLELGQVVAVKTIRPDIAGDPKMLERFHHEVQLARRIVSPYVCRIHELFVLPDGAGPRTSAFLTMEFLEGTTLADRIRDEGPLQWKEAEAIALGLCEGLQAIHLSGVVHRDLKSRNIMLTARNGTTQAVVMDFGLARQVAAGAALGSTVSGTERQAIAGTPEYMAPEQFEGGPLSVATDVYALGVVLYEMVTGVRPFSASSTIGAAVRRAKRPASASSLQRGLPRRWDLVIARCLEYEQGDRFQSAADAAEFLRAKPFSIASSKRLLKTAKTHPRLSLALLAFVVALSILGYVWFRQHRYHPPSGEAQRWYEDGVAALREGTYLKATNALKQALANDGRFALAHARLADAYNELDYYGEAKDELLKASSSAIDQTLPNLYKRYMEAIRATVLHDFTAAQLDYSAILHDLPESAKADGYVDLGRAFEKVGDLSDAVVNYTVAAKIAPQYPAAFIRLGVLEGRQNHNVAAEAAFDTAERLYMASSNYEGMAEIAYQRGSMNTSNADYPRARTELMQAFRIAENLHNTQLKARVLCRLSNLETLSLNYAQATKWAQEAMSLAETEGLAYWVTEAQTRLSGALNYQKGKLLDADEYAQRALRTAERNHWPLLAANAQFTLCITRNRQDRANEAIPLAQSALAYYGSASYFTESTRALILLIRAKRDRAEFPEALKLSQQGLELERKSGSPPVMIQLEEAVGTVELFLEKYQDALDHFEMAEAIARQNASRLLDYEVAHAADALWRLGRYEEAERNLSSLAANSQTDSYLATNIALGIGAMRLSQGRYQEAIRANERVQTLDPDAVPPDVDISTALAKMSLGSIKDALRLASRARLNAQRTSDKLLLAQARAANARIYLRMASPERAKDLAESAQATFEEVGQWDSEWQNLTLLSKISSALGDSQSSKAYAFRALDIISVFHHNCDAAAYKFYIARPDVNIAVRYLIAVTGKRQQEIL